MPGKTFLSVYDDTHRQDAEGIEYDLWQLNNGNRVQVKHDRINDGNPHVLIQANSEEELGSFELVLYVKDYFQRVDGNLSIRDERFSLPFGVHGLDQDHYLGVHITPTSYSCVL